MGQGVDGTKGRRVVEGTMERRDNDYKGFWVDGTRGRLNNQQIGQLVATLLVDMTICRFVNSKLGKG